VKERLHDALRGARAGYAELRFRRVWSTSVLVRGRAVDTATTSDESGGIARCCSPGLGWGAVGFSDPDHLDLSLLRAHELSLAGGSRRPVTLAPIPVRALDLAAAPADDPREVPLVQKRQRAEALAVALLDTDRRIAEAELLCRDRMVETWLATSEGTWLHDLHAEVSVALLAVAEEAGNVERALGSLAVRGGWRAVDAAGMVGETGARALELLHATPVRPGRYTVVLDPAAAGALMHRAVAHLARPALPGADPGPLPIGARLGPECLTLGDDPSAEGLRASAPGDDEGTTPRRSLIVQNGVVVGHLHTRETAGAAGAGQAPTGHARAATLRGTPYPRTTNTYLAQGKGSLDDLLHDIPLGIYVADVLSCELAGDSVSLGAGMARMIRNGNLAEPVKGVRIDAGLLSLLGRVDAVAGDFTWDTRCTYCRDGSAGVVPITTGAPHLRLVDLAIGEGIA
jgi:TldD protein